VNNTHKDGTSLDDLEPVAGAVAAATTEDNDE
jgi:hypothetical protein